MDDLAALRAHAVPLAGTDPALPEDDLAALLERLAGARLIGLGEATHGDHESFAFKQRLIQALVRRGLCDVVVFERGVAEMDAYDRYVTGQTDALTIGDELHPWVTEEAYDLLRRLRSWNASGGNVRFAGMDMQSPAGLALALQLLDDADMRAPAVWRRLAAEVGDRQRDLAWLEASLAIWRATAPPPFDRSDPHQHWIALLADTFGQWLETWACWVRSERDPRSRLLRDRYMAENALAQLERVGPGSAAVTWAHNDHVCYQPLMVGSHLQASLGSAYRSVCFAFGRGSFNAGSMMVNADTGQPGRVDWTLRPHPAQPLTPDSMEGVLGQLDLDCYAIPAAAVPAFRQGHHVRSVGAALADSQNQFPAFAACVPADVYDLVVYFREVQPSRLLDTSR